jgi:sugar/nucleoside kinase (ribokinase family)
MNRPLALVVGDLTLDVFGPSAGGTGGSVYYAAHALAGLGADVRVLTSLAGPEAHQKTFRVRPTIRCSHEPGRIEVVALRAPEPLVFTNVVERGSRRQRARGPAALLVPEALPDSWRAADLLLLAPVLGELDPAEFVRSVRATTVGLCVQGLVRDVRDGFVIPRQLQPDAAALGGIHVAFLGDDEAAGQPELADALAALVPVVAWTHGARGSEVRARGRTLRAGVHPAREVDPTGAGDVYAAAFLLSLARGGSLEDAARLGAAAASIVVEGLGGDALPRVAEAFARAAAVPVH